MKKITFSTYLFLTLMIVLYTSASLAADPPLEVKPDGEVAVSTEFSTPTLDAGSVNISSFLRLAPGSAPENPQEGNIYFTVTKELLLYANGRWNPIFAGFAEKGSETFTSGSGTWTVPTGVFSIKVSMTGGGGGNYPCTGNGGNGGVYLEYEMYVVPGQIIEYSVGTGGKGGQSRGCDPAFGSGNGTDTTFANLVATGGKGGIVTYSYSANGAPGTPIGTYPDSRFGIGGTGYYYDYGVALNEGNPGKPGIILIEY